MTDKGIDQEWWERGWQETNSSGEWVGRGNRGLRGTVCGATWGRGDRDGQAVRPMVRGGPAEGGQWRLRIRGRGCEAARCCAGSGGRWRLGG